jgi:hypothetical protein
VAREQKREYPLRHLIITCMLKERNLDGMKRTCHGTTSTRKACRSRRPDTMTAPTTMTTTTTIRYARVASFFCLAHRITIAIRLFCSTRRRTVI